MNEQEHELQEAELRRMRPAAPPPELMQRLAASRQGRRPVARSVPEGTRLWPLLLRWLIPATAMVVAVVVWRTQTPFSLHLPPQPAAENEPAAKADDVEIGQELVSSFDTVAALPSGEPVRFRCQEWIEQVILRDKERGLTIEQRTPRVEVIPVRFETY